MNSAHSLSQVVNPCVLGAAREPRGGVGLPSTHREAEPSQRGWCLSSGPQQGPGSLGRTRTGRLPGELAGRTSLVSSWEI